LKDNLKKIVFLKLEKDRILDKINKFNLLQFLI